MRSLPPHSPPPAYAELQAISNFSFLEGGSHPDELVAQAKAMGLAALGIADRNTVAGVVRAHVAAREVGLRTLPGARLDLACGTRLLCYPTDRAAWGRLCRLLSLGQGRAPKGACHLDLDDVASHAEGQVLIVVPPDHWDWREALDSTSHGQRANTAKAEGVQILRLEQQQPVSSPTAERRYGTRPSHLPRTEKDGGSGLSPDGGVGTSPHSGLRPDPAHLTNSTLEARLHLIKACLASAARLYLAASHIYRGDDRARLAALDALATRSGIPLVATGDVLYHAPHRRPLQDVLIAIRNHTTVGEAGLLLARNAERHLRSPQQMARLMSGYERALARTVEVVEACSFSLDELVYEYPDEPVPPGTTPQAHLEELAREGARHRFPDGVPAKVAATLERELVLIAELRLCALLPHRARHRRLRPLARHSLPGPRLGGQLGRLLLPRHHRGRPDRGRPPVRALRQPRAQGAARHRRRFRARAARGGDPVHLCPLRPRARRPRRDRHLLSGPLGGARGRQGHGPLGGYGGGARRHGLGHSLGRRPAGDATCARPASIQRDPSACPRPRTRRRADRLSRAISPSTSAASCSRAAR